MYSNLSDFLNVLNKTGEVKFIRKKISPCIGISKITDAESKSPDGGKALFFENVEDSDFPVVTNMFGSSRRICLALGVENLDQLADRLRKFTEFSPPGNLKQAFNALSLALNISRFFPRRFRGKIPPCQEVIYQGDDIDLSRLPVLTCWPKDAGPFITLPMVITRSLKTGRQNMGMYRMQIFDRNTTGMHWHIHKDGSHYYREYCNAQQRMPVSVAIGADPATIYAATAPMPRGIDEILLSGFIRNKPVVMTRCITNDLTVPAKAEFILEGYVEPGELRTEGPFGDHTGYYSLADKYPVFHLTAISHRKHPIYNATLVGRPPMEDCYLAKATERLFLPMLQTVMPEIRDYWFPWEGVFHNVVVVSLDKEYAGHAHKLISGLWGQGQMSFCKAIVVIDHDMAPSDKKTLIQSLITQLDTASDISISRGILDVLDHSSPYPNFGNKIGIDLTKRCNGEPPRSLLTKIILPFPDENRLTSVMGKMPGVTRYKILFHKFYKNTRPENRFLALNAEKTFQRSGHDIAQHVLKSKRLELFNIIILYDKDIDLEDHSLLLWKLFNNVDPGRDIIKEGNRVVIDACKKGPMDHHEREWPEDLTFDV